MEGSTLPFDVSALEERAASSFVYEPVDAADGEPADFRIVFASALFKSDWHETHPDVEVEGALVRENGLADDYALSMMERFRTSRPQPFTTFIPHTNLHLYFEPVPGLPEPYGGFYLTNMTDKAVQGTKAHFLHSIEQIGSNAVLYRRDDSGRIEAIYASESFANMMECTVPEAMKLMSGMGFYKSTSPEDRPLVRSMMRRHVAYDGTSTLTVQKFTATRKRIWCSVHYAFVDDFDESYLYCTYTDVSTLKEHEERMRSVYSSLGDSYYQATERTLSTFRANLTKDSFEEVKGKDLYDTDNIAHAYSDALRERVNHYPIESDRVQFLHTFDRKTLIDHYSEGKTSASQVFYSVRRDGRSCFVELSAAVTRHPLTGDIMAFLKEEECNAKKVAETLTGKILAQQFDMVAYLANGSYGVTIGDAARIKRGSIFPTTTTGDYAAYLESQVRPVLAGTPEERDEMLAALSLESVEEHLAVEEPYVVDIRLEIDGETFYKQFDFYTVDPQAKFYILLKSDTTAVQLKQIALNERLRDALDAANQANVAKTAFLSSMSHEIRTPMNAILGLDAIALKAPDLPPATREHLEKIGNSARHLLGLINDVLDMSRIESGRMTLKNEEFSFANMLEQINIMINGQCNDKGLAYECRILSPVDDYYIGDDMKLKQVIINILGNSVKFTPEGGKVTFTVERVADFEGQSTLRFVMADTGIGMDKEYLPKIFEAFSQEEEGKANKYGSTGLGMAITKNIVEMMNGDIAVESEKGVGSTFTVTVTLRDSNRSAQQDADIDIENMRVLVIDDDPVDCEHAKIVLEEVGIEADTCLSGREAVDLIELKAARREGYSMILVDWKMPEQDGLEVTRQIRRIMGASSAVVVLTAYNWDDIAEEAAGAGVDGFLPKPLFASGVTNALKQVMEAKRAAQGDEEAELADLEGRRILLAEDMEINAEIMIELLDMVEASADHAENGQIAVDMFAASEPGTYDAVLMDIRMPVLDGLGATEAIRALDHPDAKKVPIIAMTANAFDEDVQRSLQAGMNAHLSKPVEPDRLYQTLGELIKD